MVQDDYSYDRASYTKAEQRIMTATYVCPGADPLFTEQGRASDATPGQTVWYSICCTRQCRCMARIEKEGDLEILAESYCS